MEKKFSVKEFFKSTAFKCIYVLLAIVLVCGVLLAFCNDLFEVTAEEKLNRVLGNIYPDGNVEEIIFDADHETDLETEFEKGAVDQVYLMDDGNYLIHAYGTGGFGGNVYMWVVVEMSDGAISGIGKTQIDKNDTTGETYLIKIPGAAFDFYSENYADGKNFDVQDIKSEGLTGGATMSMTGATNAVNTALEFVRTQLLGEVIVPDEPSPFEKFSYYSETYISDDTTVELAEDGTSVIFHIVTLQYGPAGAFNIDITVNADGTIADFTITKNGSTSGYGDMMNDDILSGAMFETKNAAAILDMFKEPTGEDGEFVKNDLEDDALASGASESTMENAGYSNFICVYSALFAASNYQNGYVMALENSVEYTQYIDMENTMVSVADGTVTYNVVTTSYGQAQAFNITIIVNADGTIADFTITHNGSTDDTFKGYMNEDILSGAMFETKNAAAILDMFKEPTGEDGEFVKNDLEDSSLASGATDSTYNNAGYSNFLCVYSALFAASNYEVYTELAQYLPPAFTYTDYIDVDNTTWDIADDESSVTFHIVTKDYSPAKAFNIDITVNADGTIADFTITKNGSTDATFEGYMNDDILSGEMFETKNAAAILDMFKEPTGEDGEFVKNDLEDSSLASGATDSTYNNAGYSNFLCVYSALFAAENYDLLISGGENA